MRRLRLWIMLVTGLGVVLSAGPASAGGSPFGTNNDRYEPGETVTLVGYTGGGQLGWVEDGPFYGYLRTDPAAAEQYLSQTPGSEDFLTPFDLRVGQLVLQETGRGGYLRLRAAITFAIPADLSTGAYEFRYCNDPCTTGVGDLTWGLVHVGVDPSYRITRDWPADDPAFQGAPASVPLPPPPPTTTVLPTTTASPITQERSAPPPVAAPIRAPSDGEFSFPWLPVGTGGVLVLLAVAVLRRRRRPGEPAVDVTAAPPDGSVDAERRQKELVDS